MVCIDMNVFLATLRERAKENHVAFNTSRTYSIKLIFLQAAFMKHGVFF